jgi:hypothetical protein
MGINTCSLRSHKKRSECAYRAIRTDATVPGIASRKGIQDAGEAERILAPLKRQSVGRGATVSLSATLPALATAAECKDVIQRFVTFKATTQGTATGTALGVGSWTAVSLLGSASTGTGISTLSGIAATNATLAWFGGGSLATGGLGMAGGGAVLGGLVILPMIGISAWSTHSKAAKIEQSIRDHEIANKTNRAVVEVLRATISKVPVLIPQFERNVQKLSEDIGKAQNRLFRFGWLSRLYRMLRCYFRGYYYDSAEMVQVEALASSVDQYLEQFDREKKLLAAKT